MVEVRLHRVDSFLLRRCDRVDEVLSQRRVRVYVCVFHAFQSVHSRDDFINFLRYNYAVRLVCHQRFQRFNVRFKSVDFPGQIRHANFQFNRLRVAFIVRRCRISNRDLYFVLTDNQAIVNLHCRTANVRTAYNVPNRRAFRRVYGMYQRDLVTGQYRRNRRRKLDNEVCFFNRERSRKRSAVIAFARNRRLVRASTHKTGFVPSQGIVGIFYKRLATVFHNDSRLVCVTVINNFGKVDTNFAIRNGFCADGEALFARSAVITFTRHGYRAR